MGCMRTESKDRQAEQEIPVVFAANQEYVPVLFTCLRSLAEYADVRRNYHIYIFHTDISEGDMQVFQKELANRYIQIDFVNVCEKVVRYCLRAKEHITVETFFRFLILDILKDCPKVLYLDSDMIICRDVAELYDQKLGDAVDLDFAGQYHGANPDTRYYCEKVLKLKDPNRYMQAGVLVFNVNALNREISVRRLFGMAEKGNYRYSDQDILNVVCEGRIKKLAMSWNVMADSGNRRYDVIRSAPAGIVEEYEQARKHPYIIHYAGAAKPWKDHKGDFAQEFWKHARQTPYYEELLCRMIRKEMQGENHSYGLKVLDMLRQTAKEALPEDSRLRRAVSSLYWRCK